MTTRSSATEPVAHAGDRVLAIHPDTDAATALDVMSVNAVRHLPVVHGNQCQGLVTETDLLRAVAVAAGEPAGSPRPTVGSHCHRLPPTVRKDAGLPAVAAAILAGGLDAALVVHGGALTGIVTSTDVLAAVAEQAAQ